MAIEQPHDGGQCPVSDEAIVIVRYRNGQLSPPVKARRRRWQRWPRPIGTSDWDILAWRRAASS